MLVHVHAVSAQGTRCEEHDKPDGPRRKLEAELRWVHDLVHQRVLYRATGGVMKNFMSGPPPHRPRCQVIHQQHAAPQLAAAIDGGSCAGMLIWIFGLDLDIADLDRIGLDYIGSSVGLDWTANFCNLDYLWISYFGFDSNPLPGLVRA